MLQGLMTVKDYVQCTVDGFIDMMDMVMILMLGYAMQEVLYAMGMETFVESVCRAIPIPSLLPFLIFCVLLLRRIFVQSELYPVSDCDTGSAGSSFQHTGSQCAALPGSFDFRQPVWS